MSLAKQKMERYLLPAVPFMSLLAGVGLDRLKSLPYFCGKEKAAVASFAVLNLVFILYFYPYYLIFPSERGKDQFGCSLCSKIGEYLNQKPNPADLKIISVSEKVHRLKPFVRGKIYTTNETLPYGWTPEYVVAAKSEQVPEKYSYCTVETSISFRGVEYWDILRCK